MLNSSAARRWAVPVAVLSVLVTGALVTTIGNNARANRVTTCQALLDDQTGYAALNPPVSATDYARIYGRELDCAELVKAGDVKGRVK